MVCATTVRQPVTGPENAPSLTAPFTSPHGSSQELRPHLSSATTTCNEQADFVSRLIDLDDWEIKPSIFQTINDAWGPFTVDCFACFYNSKLPRFFSRFWNPGSSAVDAFAQNWANENCLLVPPVVLIPAVLKHLHLCNGKGALVFPWWPSSPFWPLLWSCYRWMKGFITFEGSSALQLGRSKCVDYINCTN